MLDTATLVVVSYFLMILAALLAVEFADTKKK